MTINGSTSGQENVEHRLRSAQEECERLQKENAHLRAMLGIQELIRDGYTEPEGRTPSHHLHAVRFHTLLSQPQESCRVFAASIHGNTAVYRLCLGTFRARDHDPRYLQRACHRPAEKRSDRQRYAASFV